MVLSRPRHKVRATTVVGEESTFAGAKVTRRVLAAVAAVAAVDGRAAGRAWPWAAALPWLAGRVLR